VRVTRRDRQDRAPGAERDRGERVAHLPGYITQAREAFTSKAPAAPEAPAAERRVVKDRTGVCCTQRDRQHGSIVAQIDSGQ